MSKSKERLALRPAWRAPDAGRELGWNIDDLLTSLEQPLGQRASDTVGALDRPNPVRP
ncbi:hypothetical protein [Nocardioides caldifontis]|uniref:hypothetical protein n=1 Tax=Nocardioides caldifontis TaxID=2588938 RepID=UPI00193ABA71|nr:hypothetical protein [Nocardioides caldifontis]